MRALHVDAIEIEILETGIQGGFRMARDVALAQARVLGDLGATPSH
jgi:hypothetical protein